MVRRGFSFSGHERNNCFLNTGSPRFANISAVSGIDFDDDGRGAALVDWDQDGALDVWIINRSGPQLRFLRNQIPVENDYLALQLVGKTCNRDAIGARVEVISKIRNSKFKIQKSIKTLRAGDGYLSQSTKWIHFGLGNNVEIDRVVVHWPGGSPQTYAGLRPNFRYRLVQGVSDAELLKVSKQTARLCPTDSPSPAGPPVRRHLLPMRIPLPLVDYVTFEGEKKRAAVGKGRPVLVNLWASWCGPCRSELAEWAQKADLLREYGVEIVSLSVDGLALGKQAESGDAKQYLNSIGFPFPAGEAVAEFLDKLEFLQQQLFDFHFSFAVPTSFLMDGDGLLAVIYRGPVSVDALLKDVGELDRKYDELVNSSVPFKGRWAYKQKYLPGDLAARFKGLFPEEEIRYLEFAAEELERDLLDVGLSREHRWTMERELHILRMQWIVSLSLDGQLEEAERQCKTGLDRNPSILQLNLYYAEILLRQERFIEAFEWLRHATIHNPELGTQDHFAVLVGKLKLAEKVVRKLLEQGLRLHQDDPEKAVAFHRQAVKVAPNAVQAQFGLAELLRKLGRTEEAVEAYRNVIRIEPKMTDTYNIAAWLMATHPEESLRNGTEAVEWATRACELTENRNHHFLNTLAAAYAEAGRYEEAIATAEQAIEIARGAGDRTTLGEMNNMLQAFQAGLPWRETVKNPTEL
jgi:tetratricopeptide (TPR) repeat protein